jgi:hypothetical protein
MIPAPQPHQDLRQLQVAHLIRASARHGEVLVPDDVVTHLILDWDYARNALRLMGAHIDRTRWRADLWTGWTIRRRNPGTRPYT